jgi:DNA polymerase III subunit alpha
VILYQEQAMQIAKSIAGFSGAKADDLRKAIGKKKRDAMAKLKPEFVEGCRASGTSPEVTEWLWSTNERSADYSFNKAHAAAYALISYRTAWLRANYPAEYMAALISSVMATKDKVPFFVARCEDMGIEILPPDVNESDHRFVVVDGNIRFGLDAVKGVGHAAVDAIKQAREEGGPFTSLWDFCARVDCRTVNKKSIEALIKCGAFDSTGASRKGMLAVLEAAQGAGQKAQQDALIGQGSIFDLGAEPAGTGGATPTNGFARPAHPPIPSEEFDRTELLAAEKEALGLFVSTHPLKAVRAALRARVDCSLADVAGRRDGDWATVGGIITQTKRIRTKKGDPMMFATLDDLEGTIELLVFGNVLADAEALLAPDRILTVRGRVDHRDATNTCVIVQEVAAFEPTPEEMAAAEAASIAAVATRAPLCLRVDAARLPAGVIGDLKHLLQDFPGEAEVVLEMQTAAGARRLRLGPSYRVTPSPSLRAELDHLLGDAALAA